MSAPDVTVTPHGFVIDARAWIAQRVGEIDPHLTAAVRDFTSHGAFDHQYPTMDDTDRVLLWCAALGHQVSDDTPVVHDDPVLSRPVSLVLVTTSDLRALAIVWAHEDPPTVHADITTDADAWYSISAVDIACPGGHRYTWTGGEDLFTAAGQHTTVTAVFGLPSPITACTHRPDPRRCGDCGGGTVHCPDCHQPAILTLAALPTHGPRWWSCPGCGTTVSAQPDLVTDHVVGCDWVDGAGRPVGGSR